MPAAKGDATPEHLVWHLHQFQNHQRAIRFVQQFQDTLCVFSAPVEQLYTNYEIAVPEAEERALIILPNPYAYHDTFNGIAEDSVKATGIRIVPGDGGGQLRMVLPLRHQGRRLLREVPLAVGLSALMKQETDGNPFLPVITKGDLRTFRRDAPSLHLHRILPNRLGNRSGLEVNAIRKVIREKLGAYLR